MKHILPILLTLSLLGLFGCENGGRDKANPRILYVNSYHDGYGSSDDVMQGIRDTLPEDVALRVFFMDTKNNPGEDFARQKAQEAKTMIEDWNADLLLVSDDNAVKYLVVPHFKNGPIPVVFCGVNWSCDQYGLPTDHVTGMLEVLPLEESLQTWKEYYPEMKQLVVLSENTTSERSNKELMDPLYKAEGFSVRYALVDTFDQWKEEFKTAQENADLVYLPTNGAIKNFKETEAREFVEQTIKVPSFTCDDFMMPYAVLGLTKVAKEQGEWAAETAMDILQGKDPAEIEVTKNKQTQCYFNPVLAQEIGFTPNEELRANCTVYEK
jgi:ABC-type uncharacterized transport system substrate-binding protein